ncbi:MAG: CARDB domain-containing protein, partial [Pseudomonadota bacterium]
MNAFWEEDVAESLITTLQDNQGTDGGWGVDLGHQSSVEDTALVLKALSDYLPELTVQRARDFLLGAVNEDNGWGLNGEQFSRFSTTLSAMEALIASGASTEHALINGRAWLLQRHQPSGLFFSAGDLVSLADTARALGLLIGSDTDPVRLQATAGFLAQSQGQEGDWAGSRFATAKVLLVLGRLALPNLAIRSPLSINPPDLTSGSVAQLGARIDNVGGQAVPETVLRWYAGSPLEGGVSISQALNIPALASGESTFLQFDWLVPAGLTDVELFAVADDDQILQEWTRQDNQASRWISINTPPAGLDLAVFDADLIVAPDPIESVPAEIRVTGLVRNLGLSAVSDATISLFERTEADSLVLASVTRDVASQEQVAFDLEFVYDASQSNQLRLVIDPERAIDDVDRSNNAVEFNLSITEGIDLAVDDVSFDSSLPLIDARPSTALVQISNRGLASSVPVDLRFEVEDQSGQVVNSQSQSVSLDGLAEAQREFVWIPELSGEYSISVSIDEAELVNDVDRSNNVLTLPVTSAPAEGVNLRIDPQSLSSSPNPALEQQAFTVSVTVVSDGGDDAPPFLVGLFDADPRADGQLMASAATANPLSPGESITLELAVDSLDIRGLQTLWVEVDPEKVLNQTNIEDDLAV